MPSPYSDDFREKAIAAVDRGEKKSHICRILGISRNTLDLWLKARAETGSFKAKRNYSRGPAPKIKNLEEFRQFACLNGGKTQQQMAERWPEKISRITIGKALNRIGFTRKKKLTGTEKEMKKSELSLSSISVSMLTRDSFTSMKQESMIQKIIPTVGVRKINDTTTSNWDIKQNE